MNSNEVMNVINLICEKIGVVSEFGIAEFTKYTIGKSVCAIIFDIIIFILLVFFCKKAISWSNKTFGNDEDSFLISVRISIIGLTIISSLLPFFHFYNAIQTVVGFIISPTGATISYIANMIS